MTAFSQQGVWQSWTPTFSSWTVGSGGSAGTTAQYAQTGKTVTFYIISTLGTTGSSVGSNAQFSLPVTANSIYSSQYFDVGNVVFNLSGTLFKGTLWFISTTTAQLLVTVANQTSAGATGTTSTVPGTWAAGNNFTATGTYQAA